MKALPGVVAELGPGNSLGIGLSTLLSGADRYHAFDVVPHAQVNHNLAVLDELIALFKARADIPGPAEFPQVARCCRATPFPITCSATNTWPPPWPTNGWTGSAIPSATEQARGR